MFQNLKIVELASVVAGPLAGTFFSELGAEVIKIENKRTKGDVTRQWKLPKESKESPISAYYSAVNYSKQSLLLDLTDDVDYKTVISHIQSADIVIVNYSPSTTKKLKLDYARIKNYNKAIIYAELTGFPDTSSRPAYDAVMQAETGFMFMNGEPNGQPVKMPVALIHVLSAHHLKEAILCALINKLKTGEGKHIQISLYECALASLINQATNWLMEHHIPRPMGTQHPNIAPYGDMYRTSDGNFLILAIGSDRHFDRLCTLLEISNKGLETNMARVANRTHLNDIINACIEQETSQDWASKFEEAEIPFGLVKNMQEVFQDKMAQDMLLEETIEGIPTIRVKTALI